MEYRYFFNKICYGTMTGRISEHEVTLVLWNPMFYMFQIVF